jgi:hypothetical protein
MLGQATSLPPAEAKILEKSTGFGRKTNDERSERGLDRLPILQNPDQNHSGESRRIRDQGGRSLA